MSITLGTFPLVDVPEPNIPRQSCDDAGLQPYTTNQKNTITRNVETLNGSK